MIPIAIKGVKYRPVGADALLANNLLVYGLGGLVVPFIGIKAIDLPSLLLVGFRDFRIEEKIMLNEFIRSFRLIGLSIAVCVVAYTALILETASVVAPEKRLGSLFMVLTDR